MELTTQQFNKLAVKKDLEKFATKDDLKKLRKESKSDIKKLEKKMDKKFDAAFDMFASKNDLKEAITESEERITKKINKIFTAVDSIAIKCQETEAERAANISAHDRIEADIAKTNKRVAIVEKKLEAVPVASITRSP